MKFNLTRITTSGKFIPEVDGIRFLAIFSIVVFHLTAFLNYKNPVYDLKNLNFTWLNNLAQLGQLGVPLFFVISGFIIALPFCNFYLNDGNEVSWKSYYWRRLTRLTPPYFLVMTLLLFGAVYVAESLKLREAMISYFSSLFTIHNFVYGRDTLPLLNSVAWSLEVEVQFYILAPVIAKLLYEKNLNWIGTRTKVISAILILVLFNSVIELPFISIIDFFKYFLLGFLLADVYITRSYKNWKSHIVSSSLIISALILSYFLFVGTEYSLLNIIIKDLVSLSIIYCIYYLAIVKKTFSFLSGQVNTNLGGMCYSLYLLHYPIISFFGNKIILRGFSPFPLLDYMIYAMILLVCVFGMSLLFYILIERLFMSKFWTFNTIKDRVQSLITIYKYL